MKWRIERRIVMPRPLAWAIARTYSPRYLPLPYVIDKRVAA